MGKRKTVAREVGGVRNKTVVIDVDEKSIGTELSEEESIEVQENVTSVAGNQKSMRVNDNILEIQFTEKKPESKGEKGENSFGDDTFDVTKDVEEDASVVFSGKKKPSKSKKVGIGSAFDATRDDSDDELVDNSESKQQSEDEGEEQVISFPGKKKKLSKSNKKTSSISSKEADVPETWKNKKKKKDGRTIQEEVDIDKILAELGGAPVAFAAVEPPQEEKVQHQAGSATVADEVAVEPAAAAKKKKKKKEKKKEQKSETPAVEEKPVESEAKVLNKKVPKHVREIQERLARIKEAEERRNREEEERLRKEEEERLRQEEVEERKRMKKEKEKEKMLKKKQEGKLLTAKQKAEAQRLELMRNQILEKGGALLQSTGETSGKRPIYITKKSKPHQHASGKTTTSNQEDNVSQLGDSDKADEDDMENGEEKAEAAAVEEEIGNKEDGISDYDWDAKSWDDDNLNFPELNAFANEGEGTVPAPAVEKQNQQPVAIKGTQQAINGKNEEEAEKTLRSPICCIMGHVDSGKTKLLDCIRKTNVQESEAGGITQQIGASYIPVENIRERTKELKADAKLNVPGLLVIDTPGHEAFNNLRSRGSGLCDIAVLVVDIMHGLKPQTIESINLLRMRKTEFIVALNKVDRLYGWKTCHNAPIGKAMKQQSKDVQCEFDHRVTQIITQFKEQGLNTELYNKNKDRGETYSIVPTSAISGEGIPEMLLLLIQWAQKTMVEKLTYNSEIQCTVLEVKVIQGCGTTIDVVLVNGVLHEGDEIVVCGFQGPIHTTIRSLTPHLMKELGGAYKEIKAAQVIKITAQNLEHAVAGTALYVVGPDNDVEEIKESVMDDMRNVMSRINKSGEGVYVHASTLGSLEALLELLKTPPVSIPVCGIGIGPVHKKDVMKASAMREKKKEFATILAFDVKVAPEAREFADNLGVKIFIADTIYHFLDQFKAYVDNLKEEMQQEAAEDAVFPCVLEIMPNCVFNKNDPIILGVDVKAGILKIGTPICIPNKNFIDIGRISSIKKNDRPVDHANKGQTVAIKITGSNAEEQQKRFGRHFDMEDELVSRISRHSINALKANYRDELSIEEWKLVKQLKERVFKIQ